MKGKQTSEVITQLILETSKEQKLQNTEQLIEIIQQKTGALKEQIIPLLIQLENDGRIQFAKQTVESFSFQGFVFSKQAFWFWLSVTLSAIATAATYTISVNEYPVVYLRLITGIPLILFLSGFSLMKALYPLRPHLKASSQNLDAVERLALSICLSLSLVAVDALILNYTSLGINLNSIILSLLSLTVAFATVGIIREFQIRKSIDK